MSEVLMGYNFFFFHVDCGPLSDPDNGQVDTSEGTTYGKTATYTCNPGYRFLGDDTRLCQTDGQWSDGAPPVCYPIGKTLSQFWQRANLHY